VGVFVPGLPTTIFVIIASFCFARSSPRLDRWLRGHRWLGPPLRRFVETRSMTRRAKAFAITSMWAGVGMSWVAAAGFGAAWQAATIALGLAGTAAVAFYVRTEAAHPAHACSVPLYDTALPM
jgi:uncharacterized membrane protein YbaN (DUF454 family)